MARRTYGRKAFGPHNPSTRTDLALDIAHSILTHRSAGRVKRVTDYTNNPGTIKLVHWWINRMTHPVQSDEAQQRRREQQAWLDSCRAGNLRQLA